MNIKEDLKDWINKRYAITCPYCNLNLHASRSLAHHFGIKNGGLGICIECGEEITLWYDYENDNMIAKEISFINL